MINKIAVLGAGTMGHGIAATFAVSGYSVNIYDNNEATRSKVQGLIESELELYYENQLIEKKTIQEAIDRINICSQLEETVKEVDYVIEATPEVLEIKQKIFKEIDKFCKETAIFASNTSSLPLNKMLDVLSKERKKRMMVCHWYNPAFLMPLVELSFFGNTSEDVYQEVEALYTQLGKTTIKVLKDIPGLVANRIQQGIAREVFSLMEMGVASPEDIDKALKFGPAFRYATTGQLEIADMGGLDIWCTVGDNLLSVMDNRKDSNPILRKKVVEGKLGVKVGEGFFKYPDDVVEEIKESFIERLCIQLKTSNYYKCEGKERSV